MYLSSVGNLARNRVQVDFFKTHQTAAKLPRSIQSPQMDRQRRKLYQPPTRRDNHNAADEKLQVFCFIFIISPCLAYGIS